MVIRLARGFLSMLQKMAKVFGTRRRWLVLVMLILIACICLLLGASVVLVRNVPGIARWVYGDPPASTSALAFQPTFAPPSIATLTPTPPDTATATLPGPSLTPVSEATSAGDRPTEQAIVLPSRTLTPELPTPTQELPTPLPAGQWLAFETKRGRLGDYEIFGVTTDGSRLANLTNSWADDTSPVWSPDGRRIAFVSLRDTPLGKWGLAPGSLYLMDFDPVAGVAGDLFRLTDGTNHDGWPTWSPDGRRIAFHSGSDGERDIWVINRDGSGRTQLTDSRGDDAYPAWSPDGSSIAFTSKRGGKPDIWVMNADGSDPVNLTKSPSRDRYPMWSPDGAKIAFNTNRDGNQEIYVMDADGSNPVNVSQSPSSTEGLADWSPDGKRLVFYSDRSGSKDIYILDLTTGQWTPIITGPSSDEFCTWSP
jgi:Tol biopolymer transport system component